MGEKIIFLQNPWIPPQIEIWSGSNGSHPKEKSGQIPGSHPEGNFGWENRMEKKSEVNLDQKKLSLAFKVMTSK